MKSGNTVLAKSEMECSLARIRGLLLEFKRLNSKGTANGLRPKEKRADTAFPKLLRPLSNT
ncbi:MAG: hypothetical protein C4B58_16595 [Deltaproteobacteria bacterium]|nr:MAG: hypothetical protein C4B58_16595 [Deltaproteobacteria bacterium]